MPEKQLDFLFEKILFFPTEALKISTFKNCLSELFSLFKLVNFTYYIILSYKTKVLSSET